jgi:hypothetical protein
MGASISAKDLQFDYAQFLAILFLVPIAFAASFIANSVFTIEMIKKENEKNAMDKGKYDFMLAISAFNIVICVLAICISIYYGIYFALPQKYKLKFDEYSLRNKLKDYIDSLKNKLKAYGERKQAERVKKVLDRRRADRDLLARAQQEGEKFYNEIFAMEARGASKRELAEFEANRFKANRGRKK